MLPLDDHDPTRIASYRVMGRLGVGGMGVVYVAETPGRNRVAIKCVHSHLVSNPEFRRRFTREVAATRMVDGLCTARVVDADTEGEFPYLVMEYVDGPSLAEVVAQDGPLSDDQVVVLAAGLAEALVSIHAAGISHRDLKPANVLLSSSGPKVIDFGISAASGASTLTQQGTVVGTPAWLSPEHVNGGDVSFPADIFSWAGVVVYAATGQPPFGEVAPEAYAARLLHAEPKLTGTPAALVPVLTRAFAKDAEARPTAPQLLQALIGAGDPVAGDVTKIMTRESWPEPTQQLTAVAPTPSRRRSWGKVIAASVAVALAIAGGSVYAATRSGGHRAAAPPAKRTLASRSSSAPTPSSATSAPAAPVDSKRIAHYVNHRFGMSVSVPAGLTVSRAATGSHDGASGQVFTTPDGKVSMTAVAWPNTSEVTAAEDLSELKTNADEVGQQITYSTATASVAALSGYQDNGRIIFYTRDVVTPTVVYSLQWLFPTASRSTYKSQVDHTAHDFQPNTGVSDTTGAGCTHITYGADGTAGPTLCADGQPNPPVLAYYRRMDLAVLSLGRNASPSQVLSAMCKSLPGSSYPIETDAYQLAAAINGWSFGIDPSQEMTSGACSN